MVRQLHRHGPFLISLLVLLGGWEAAVANGVLREAFFPRPSVLVGQVGMLLSDGTLILHTRATLGRLVAAFLLAALPGIALGLALGVWRSCRAALEPLIAFVYPIPSILYLPLAALILGRGEGALIFTATVTSFFLIAINTMAGVQHMDRAMLEAATHFGATGPRLFVKVLLPGTLPGILTGARLALGLSLIVVIAAEMVAAQEGLGALLWLSWQILKVRDMYASLLVIATLGLLTTYGLERVRARLLPWQADRAAPAVGAPGGLA
jgi:ABC-type nitrate/sulfonate/bicarbonate transport system permease component